MRFACIAHKGASSHLSGNAQGLDLRLEHTRLRRCRCHVRVQRACSSRRNSRCYLWHRRRDVSRRDPLQSTDAARVLEHKTPVFLELTPHCRESCQNFGEKMLSCLETAGIMRGNSLPVSSQLEGSATLPYYCGGIQDVSCLVATSFPVASGTDGRWPPFAPPVCSPLPCVASALEFRAFRTLPDARAP